MGCGKAASGFNARGRRAPAASSEQQARGPGGACRALPPPTRAWGGAGERGAATARARGLGRGRSPGLELAVQGPADGAVACALRTEGGGGQGRPPAQRQVGPTARGWQKCSPPAGRNHGCRPGRAGAAAAEASPPGPQAGGGGAGQPAPARGRAGLHSLPAQPCPEQTERDPKVQPAPDLLCLFASVGGLLPALLPGLPGCRRSHHHPAT